MKELLKQQTVTTSPIAITTPTTSASISNNSHTSDTNSNNYSVTAATISLLLSNNTSGFMVTSIPSGMEQINDAIKMESALTCSQPFNNLEEDSNSRNADKPLDPECMPKLCEGIPDPFEKTINQLKQVNISFFFNLNFLF